MSSSYEILAGERYSLNIYEMSSELEFEVWDSKSEKSRVIQENISTDELLIVAENIIKAVSYYSEDPEEILKKYNVRY